MEQNKKILDLAKKLKALADKGVGGEKENALTMLKKLMTKHNISMEMIEENFVTEHEFYIEFADYKFWRQVVSSVMGRISTSYKPAELRKKKRHYYVECTPAQAIEIQAKFDFYITAWHKDLEIFYSAFIQKNKLFQKPSAEDKNDDKELTKEEKETLWKMMNIMAGIEQHQFLKQLTTKL